MSRNKGKTGERELANILKEHGYDARRGQQFSGANGDADVVGLPGIHIEVKRTETLSLYTALEQAESDAREGEIPVVFHRRNHKRWVVIMELEYFLNMYQGERYVDD
jgi:Holliday junction resolvase